jgi:hypothetical protein
MQGTSYRTGYGEGTHCLSKGSPEHKVHAAKLVQRGLCFEQREDVLSDSALKRHRLVVHHTSHKLLQVAFNFCNHNVDAVGRCARHHARNHRFDQACFDHLRGPR